MSSEVMTRMSRRADALPAWATVLAVVAHPDDGSFGLGALLDAFARAGAGVEALCLTHGEASTLHGAPGDLALLRGAELAAAADVLGVTRAMLKDHADGALSDLPGAMLAAEVVAAADSARADGLLVFDIAGVTGHSDHVSASAAGLLNQGLGASFIGHLDQEIDPRVTVDRARQRLAHVGVAGQALPSSVLWRRLELLGDTESLRWLRRPIGATVGP